MADLAPDLALGGGGNSTLNSHLVFYSEGKQYYHTFKPILDALDSLKHPYIYLTSGDDDPALLRGEAQSFGTFEYIGAGNKAYVRLNTLRADICVLTTPGLDVLQIKRSRGVRHYCHIVHSLTPMTYRAFGLDYFDSVLVANEIQRDFVREVEEAHGVKRKYIGVVGSTYLDELSVLRHSVLSDKAGSLIVGGGHYRLGSSLASNLHNPTFSSQSLECQEGKPSAECKANSESKTITESTTLKNLNEALPNINNARDNASLAESNFAKSHTNSEFAHKEQHEILGFEMKNRGFGARSEEATLAVVPEAERVDSLMRDQRGQISEGKSTQKTSQGKAQGLGGSILDEKSGLCSRERGDKTRASIDEVSDKLPDLSLKDNAPQSMPTILISPSWGKETLLTKYGLTLLEPLAQAGFSLIIRPHPQSLIGEAESKNIAHLQEALQQYANVAWDIGTPNVYAFAKADMMISDFSSVIFDFVCLEGKPVLTLDFAFDPAGYDLSDIDMEHFYTFETLKRIGGKLEERDFGDITSVIAQILESNKTKEAQKCKEELWRYPHHAGLKAVQEILKIERELLEQSLKAYMPQVRRIREIDAMLEGVR
ncbi:CDP-glycerol glycerophosphotransferase family protein [uncultured Helicobacter sp.]|uniref:CDP-glycerol glycerophosphotransferase family protein n=1 Tax=uncultured Helicobacter sp. TaxID=175537 RepID=UPI0037528AC4